MRKIVMLVIFLFTPHVVWAACTSSPGGDLPGWGSTVTLSSCNKTIAGTTGADWATTESSTTNTAALTLSGTTSLTINAGGHLVVGSLNIGAGTTISLATGADIKTRTPIYIADADADGWSSTAINSATLYTATASGRRRLALMRGWTADCGDTQYATNNVCCNNNGAACGSDGACCGNICGTDADSDNLFSLALGHTGTCQATLRPYTDTNDAQACPTGANPTGTCKKCVNGAIANQTSSEDLFSECAASLNACSGTTPIGPDGNCNGSGACKTTGNTGSACATAGTCKSGGGCSGGSCVAVTNVAAGTDPNNQCTASYNACSGNNRVGPDGNCNGSGACNTGGLSSNCGGDYWDTAVNQCVGSMRQSYYHSRGCSVGNCYDNISWQNYQECGGDYWGATYQCSGNQPQRDYYSRGCSAGACYGPTGSWQNWGAVCATRGICQTGGGCSAGSCVGISNAGAGTDPNNECNASAASVVFNQRSGGSCNDICSMYYSNGANCNGAGACYTPSKTCVSIGSNGAGANDGWYYKALPWCGNYVGNCSTVMSNEGGGSCFGAYTYWTYCLCQ